MEKVFTKKKNVIILHVITHILHFGNVAMTDNYSQVLTRFDVITSIKSMESMECTY